MAVLVGVRACVLVGGGPCSAALRAAELDSPAAVNVMAKPASTQIERNSDFCMTGNVLIYMVDTDREL
jgi:hypothetical protein